MADGASTNFSFIIPEEGASSDDWGGDLNANWTQLDGILYGSSMVRPDLTEGLWKIEGFPVTSTAEEINKLGGLIGTPLTDSQTDTLGKGFDVTDHDAGTLTTGTFTPDPANGNQQYAVNGGAHTLAPPDTSCTMVIQYTNSAGAGTITPTGFTIVSGDPLTAANGDDFICYITRANNKTVLNVVALQ